jgi:hypothetical protein
VLPFHEPIHLEWKGKEKKRKKNGPKVEEDFISRQIFSATTGGEARGRVYSARGLYVSAALMHFLAIFHSN